MGGVRITRCNPTLLDFVTWAIMKGCRLFQRVHITPLGLLATERIPEFDFVAVVPIEATQSVLSIASDPNIALKVSPERHGESVPFWEDLTRGSFAFVGFLTKVLLTGQPRGVQSYLDVLPFDQAMPIGKVADAAQATKGYKEWTAPLVAQCNVEASDFDVAFRHAYCLFRRHAIPFLSTSDVGSVGHPYFQQSPFAQRGQGELMGMVPVMDLALHSSNPNAMIGYPDEEMLQWLAQQKKAATQHEKGYFVMQALRDIEKGEMISVNKNAHFNFDEDTFKAWFGYPNASQVAVERAESSFMGRSQTEGKA
ncbi:putative SET domain containing protein [Leishmania naiffi]|uniref:SET domain containing protein n=1 Tax=Leishmania naiffi TaxID=5678 RepID=A0AAW3B6T1_9TRYP